MLNEIVVVVDCDDVVGEEQPDGLDGTEYVGCEVVELLG